MQVDGLVLAGGKSRRMGGFHKGELVYRRQTFLEHVIGEFRKEAGEIWISYGTEVRKEYDGCRIVTDEFPECGPMGGIHAGLRACRNEYVMAAACDMPFLEIELYRYLYERLRRAEAAVGCAYMGAVPVADGKVHPLAAIYRKELEQALGRRLKSGNYRLTEALESQRILYADVSERMDFRKMLMNVNTVSEYEALAETDSPGTEWSRVGAAGTVRASSQEREQTVGGAAGTVRASSQEREQTGVGIAGAAQTTLLETEQDGVWAAGRKREGCQESGQRIVAVCGKKNSGKTTLLVRLIRELTKRGIRAAVIKHDGHDFSCDIPGTDSYRFQEAGAYGTAVYSRHRTFIHKLGEPEPEELIRQFPEADIIFIEGMKDSTYPKLEVVRRAVSDHPVSNPEGRFLLVTDWETGHFQEPSAGFDELERIIEMIMGGERA